MSNAETLSWRVHAVATIKGKLTAPGELTSRNGIRWLMPTKEAA